MEHWVVDKPKTFYAKNVLDKNIFKSFFFCFIYIAKTGSTLAAMYFWRLRNTRFILVEGLGYPKAICAKIFLHLPNKIFFFKFLHCA